MQPTQQTVIPSYLRGSTHLTPTMKDNIYTTPNKNIETYQEGHSAKTKNAPPSMLKTNLRRGLRSSFDTSKSSPSLATSAKSEVINIPEIQTDSSRMDIEDVEDENDRWVTVFGFPQNYTSIVTKYFGDCGEIIKQKHAENQGNWIHLLFRTKLDAERALGKNGKIIDSKLNIMIGVIKTSKIMNINKLDKMETIKQPEIERTPKKTGETNLYPTPSKSYVSKFLEYVIGI